MESLSYHLHHAENLLNQKLVPFKGQFLNVKSIKKAELTSELTNLNLPTHGLKEMLFDRLRQHYVEGDIEIDSPGRSMNLKSKLIDAEDLTMERMVVINNQCMNYKTATKVLLEKQLVRSGLAKRGSKNELFTRLRDYQMENKSSTKREKTENGK